MAACTDGSSSFDCKLQKSSTIKQMKAKDQQLQSQIDSINWKIGTDWESSIWSRLDNLEDCCEDKQNQLDQQKTVISEIGDNITLLKGMYTRQDIKINGLLRNVIIDDTYRNFSDWVENVYIPQWESLENKYTQWDIYMNVNQDVWATNATYVCIRRLGSKSPLSANDWQELYYSAPSDVQAILWIDPVEVTHPYKHERVISIDPDKFAVMLSQLQSLDLSNVNVTLWDVYFNPIIKESVTIQENLDVWNTATVNSLEANTAHIKEACIEEMKCDTKFTWKPEFLNAKLTWTFDVHEVKTDTATITEAWIWKMTENTDFTNVIPEFWTANIQTQLNVKRTDWEWAHFKKACIEEMVCDTKYWWKITGWEWEIVNLNVETFIQEWGTAEFNWYTEFNWWVELNVVEWDTQFNDTINAPDINISNNTTTQNITVENVTNLNWPVNINSYINYTDDEWKIVCVWNALENLFRPSYWIFKISWWWASYAWNWINNLLYWLWSDWIKAFNNAQWSDAVYYIPVNTQNSLYENNTYLERDEENTTPWVWLNDSTGSIIIDWTWEDAWLYTVHFNMTIQLDDVSDNTPMNVWSHRAWVVVYNKDNLTWRIIDDKCEAQQNLYKYTFTHTHWYYDSDTWEDSSGSRNRTTDPYVFNIQNPNRCEWWNWWSDVVIRVQQYYTYTKTLTIPVDGICILAPYFKPSAWCPNKWVHFLFSITEWRWNTWSESQIFVQKVANLWKPKEYHC